MAAGSRKKMKLFEISMRVADTLLRLNGTDVSKYDDTFLKASLQKRLSDSGCETMEGYLAVLEHSDGERATFIDSLRINYTEFFRNPLTFAVLERMVLPGLVAAKKKCRGRELRIWSAACAGGPEAYSLAMLLEELRNGDSQRFKYRIFATDQATNQVHTAIKGHYATAALGNVSLKRLTAWFTRQGDIYAVSPELQKNIDFSTFDLFNQYLAAPPASIFGDFDIVVCANLLFYYKNEYRNILLDKIRNSLAQDGCLISGETEREILMRENFHELFPQSAVFKRGKP
jgi:chemotaxis methyl-accepting protein methylase